MTLRLPFRHIEPTFCAGLLDDPLLLVHIKPLGRSALFDCGQLHHLAKRVLKRVDALFVSHAHMDHFMGIDTFVRHNHVSPRAVDIFGPPGIAAKLAGKLAGYDWNLTEPYWCTFRVHDVSADLVTTTLFPGPDGFPCRPAGEQSRLDRVIYRNDYLEVAAELCDHRIPALVFRATERASFLVDGVQLEERRLIGGDWLRELKKRFYGGKLGAGPLTVLRRRGESVEPETVEDVAGLYEAIQKREEPASIGYIGDIGFTEENVAKVAAFLRGVTLLVCECSFLSGAREKARVSHHLCTDDLNRLVDRLRPRFVLPMHLSKNHRGESRRLYDELEMPPGVTLLRLPEHLTPRPLLASEMPKLGLGTRDSGLGKSNCKSKPVDGE